MSKEDNTVDFEQLRFDTLAEENEKEVSDESTESGDTKEPEVDLDVPVTRRELIEIMNQVGDNINQISNYLMEDMNTLYAKQVFPFQMRFGALEDILSSKEVVTKEAIDALAEENFKKLQEQAKEIKEAEEKSEELPDGVALDGE